METGIGRASGGEGGGFSTVESLAIWIIRLIAFPVLLAAIILWAAIVGIAVLGRGIAMAVASSWPEGRRSTRDPSIDVRESSPPSMTRLDAAGPREIPEVGEDATSRPGWRT
jgi:hypothetical protein